MPEALAAALEVVDDPDPDAELEPDDDLELELPQAAINTELAAATATRRRLRETLGFNAGSPELSMGQVRAKIGPSEPVKRETSVFGSAAAQMHTFCKRPTSRWLGPAVST